MLPDGADPASYLTDAGPHQLHAALNAAAPLADPLIERRIDWYADRLDTAEGTLAALRSASAVIAALPPAAVARPRRPTRRAARHRPRHRDHRTHRPSAPPTAPTHDAYTRAQAAIDTDSALANIADPTRTDDTATTTSRNVNDRTAGPNYRTRSPAPNSQNNSPPPAAASQTCAATATKLPRPNSAHDHRDRTATAEFDWQTYEPDTRPRRLGRRPNPLAPNHNPNQPTIAMPVAHTQDLTGPHTLSAPLCHYS